MKKLFFALLLSFGFVGFASASIIPPDPVTYLYSATLVSGEIISFNSANTINDSGSILFSGDTFSTQNGAGVTGPYSIADFISSTVDLHSFPLIYDAEHTPIPLGLNTTEISQIIGIILGTFGAFFGFIAVFLAVIAGNTLLFRWFKKIFPNASR